jgi:hypothetical protein
MLKKKIAIIYSLLGILMFAITGCEKATTIVINPGSSITTEMSFANDIIPIFTKSCALSGCHSSGGRTPDLSAANAYNSLITGNFVKANNPDNSDLMLWLTGKKSSIMPLGSSSPNQDINAKIYAWIKQGAKNN